MRSCSFHFLIAFIVGFFSTPSVYSQQCAGADGSGYLAIGVTTAQAGNLCANKDALGARLRIQVGNIAAADIPTMYFTVDWGDGSAPVTINSGFINTGGNDYEVITPSHFFPVTGASVDCRYQPTVSFGFGAVECLASYGSPPDFRRFNTDDPNGLPGTGDLQLISPNGTAIYEVCAGATTIVTFTDQSTLNCALPPVALPNNGLRSRRFIYGTTGSTIANVLVDGVAVPSDFISAGMPFNQTPSTGPLNDNDATTPEVGDETAQIAVPNTAVAGQSYFIQMDYWNQCNPFLGGDAPVSVIAEIRVVAQPTPPTAVDQTVCKGTIPNAFSLTGVPAGATVNWYENNNGAVGPLLQSSSATLTLAINNYDPAATDSLQTNVAGYYKVWASYTPNVVTATNCETVKVPVTIIIRQQISTPGEINGPTEVCADGSTVYTFDLTADSPTLTPSTPPTPTTQLTTVGGTTQYNWSFSVAANIDTNPPPAGVGPSGTTNKQFGAVFNTGLFGVGTSLTRTLRVNSTYTSGTGACTSTDETDLITIHKVSNGGLISPASGDICSGDSKDFELTGTIVGAVQRWEFSTDAGATWSTDTDLGNASNPAAKTFTNPSNPPVTYLYRAIVKNGACSEIASAQASFTVYPVPPKPAITTLPASGSICNDGSSVTITSDNVGGIGTVFRWYKLPDETTPVAISASNQLVLNAVSQSGDYKVEILGPTPLSCGSQISDPVTVAINPLPEVTNVSGGGAACDSSPAPDIVFQFSGGTSYNFTIDVPGVLPDIIETNWSSNTYTLSGQTEPGSYSIIALSNAVTGCVATVLGGSASVISAGGAPSFDAPRIFAPAATCENGGSTTDPTLTFSLNATLPGNFILTYRIDALAPRTLTFTVDGAGTPVAPLAFSDTELDVVGSYTITLVSIETPSGCFAVFNEPFAFEVNEIPADPTGAVSTTICSVDIGTATVQVDDPGAVVANVTIDWYSAASGGTLLASGNHIFNPAPADEPGAGLTNTYYAETRNSVTGCVSTSRVAVTLTADASPGTSSAGAASFTCDLTSTLSANAPVNGGIGTWSVGTPLYYETFSSADNDLGIAGPNPHATNFTHPLGKWSVTVPSSTLFTQNTDWIKVNSGAMSVRDVTSEVIWQSSVINISAAGNVSIAAQITEVGNQTASEYIRLSYILDGLGEVQFGNITDEAPVDGQFQTFTVPSVSGSTLRIVMRARNTADADRHLLDNVIVLPVGSALPVIQDVNDPNSAVSNLQEGANVFTWTITSALGACTPSTSTMTITRNPQPVSRDITQSLCDESATGLLQVFNYNLTVHDAAVADNEPNREVVWYTDASLTLAVTDPTDVDFDNGDIFYARVRNTLTNCNNVTPFLDPGSVTFTVNALPVANIPPLNDRSFCEDVSGSGTHAGVNLATQYNPLINPAATIAYYPALTDAQNGTNQILPGGTPDESNFTVDNIASVFARVEDGNGCVNYVELAFEVNSIPLPNPLIDQSGNSGTINVCRDATAVRPFQVTDENRNDDPVTGDPSTYAWTVPPQFVTFAGGNPTEALVLLRFPTAVSSPGLALTVQETSSKGCVGPVNSITIVVDAQPAPPVITGPGDVCADQQSIVYSITPPNATSTYSWSVPGALGAIALGQGTSSITINAGPDVDGTLTSVASHVIQVTEISSAGCNSSSPDTHAVNVHDKPTISPLSTLTICSGAVPNENIILSLPSSTYTWEVIFVTSSVTGVNLGDTGTGDITHALTNNSNADGSVIYRITAFGPDIDATTPGNQVCQGQQTTLTIKVEPVPTLTFTNATPRICTGGTPNFTVTSPTVPTVPADLRFNVAVNIPLGITGSGLAAVNQNNLTAPFSVNSGTLTNTTDGALTVQYTITPTLVGCSNGPTQIISVVVDPAPEVDVVNVPPPTICNNGNVNIQISTPTTANNASDLSFDLSVSSTNVPLTAGTAFSTLSNQPFPRTLNGTLTNASSNVITVTFTMTPKLNGCSSGLPVSTTVEVEPTPQVNLTNNTLTVCNNGVVNMGVASAAVPTIPGNLEFDVAVTSSNPAATGGTSFTSLSGQSFPATIGGTLTNSSTNVVTVTYSFTPKLNGCANGTVQTTTVQVQPVPQAIINNTTPVICNGSNVGIQITSPTIPSVPANLTFDVGVTSTGAIGGTAAGNLSNQSFPLTIGGTLTNTNNTFVTVTYTVTPKLNGCANGVQQVTTAIVEPTPQAIVLNNDPTVCNGGTPDIDITAASTPNTPANLTFEVSVALPSGVTGTGVAAFGTTSASAPFSINAGTLTNSSNSAKTVVYSITPKLTSCSNGPVQTVNVVVEPTPQASFVNNLPKVCNNGTPNITVTSNTASSVAVDLTFDVIASLPGGVTGTLMAGNGTTSATAPFSINTGSLTNNTNIFQTVTYLIRPKIAGCADGPDQVVQVVVEPTPLSDLLANNFPVICNAGTPSIDIVSPTTPSIAANMTFDVTVTLPSGVTGTGVAGNGTGGLSAPFSINSGTLTNSTNSFKPVTYTITPKLNGCSNGPTRTVTVDVEPTPQVAFANNTPAICSDGTPDVALSSSTSPTIPGNLVFNIVPAFPAGISGTGLAISGVNGVTAPFSLNSGTLTHFNGNNIPLSVTYAITPRLIGCADGPAQIVNVTVRPDPIGQDDSSTEICSGESFSYNLQTKNIDVFGNGVVSVFTYTVVSSNTAAVVAPADRTSPSNAPISGTFSNISGADVILTYTVTAFNASGNCVGNPFDVVVVIHSEPTAPALTTIERCSGSSVNFTLQDIINNTAGGGNSVLSKFKYTVASSNPMAVFPGPNRNSPSTAQITDTYTNTSNADVDITYAVTPLDLTGDCEGAPFELRVTVHPEPVGISVLDPVCNSALNHNIQASHIDAFGGNNLPSIFTYVVSSTNAGAVPPAPDRLVASSSNITDVYTNTSGSDVTITYTITPFNAANPTCSGAPFSFQIVISSKPAGASSTVSAICSDAGFNIDPQGNITNGVTSTFTWTATYDAGLTGGVSSGTGTVTGFLLNNSTPGVKNAYFEVIPRSGSCAGLPFTTTLPVNPEPVITATFTTPVCSDVASNIVLSGITGASAPDNFDIALVSQDADLTANPANAILTVGGTLTGVSATALQLDRYTNDHRTIGLKVEYLITPRGTVAEGACAGNNLSIVVEVLPEPVMEPTLANATICSDVANGIELVSDGISINAQTFFVNSITVQSTGTAIAPGGTVADVTSKLGNATANPATPRDKNFIRNDQFTVTDFDASANNNTVVYNITPRSGGLCLGNAFDINLHVLPEPTFTYTVPPPVCSDEQINLVLTENGTSTDIFQYVVSGITRDNGLLPGGSNISIGQTLLADASGNAGPVLDTYTNGSSTNLIATYSIKPVAVAVSGKVCEGDVVNAIVTIRPSPLVLTALSKIVCNDAVTGITIGTQASSAPAQSFEIIRNPLPVGLAPGVFTAGTQLIDGASTTNISTDHLVNSTDNPLVATYAIRANTNAGGAGCYGPTELISVTVEPPVRVTLSGPPGNTNNAKPNICSVDDTQITLISPSNPSAGNVTFNFTGVAAIAGTVSGISSGSNLNENDVIGQILSNSSNSPVDVTYTVTPRANSAAGGNGCVGIASATIVKVEPKPKMAATPSSITVCEGVPLAIDLSSATVPSSGAPSVFFQLTAVQDPNTLSSPASVSGFATTYPTLYNAGTDALDDVLVNTAIGQEPIRYLFTPSFTVGAQTCVGDPVSVNVTVSPRPFVDASLFPAIDPKCSGEAFTVDYSAAITQSDPSSTLASWTFAYTPSGDPDLTGASNGAGTELSQVIFNKNRDRAAVTYSVKAKSFGCESNTITIPVEVNPTPKITGLPGSVNVCDDGSLNVPLTSSADNTTYTWAVDDESQPDLTGAADQPTPVVGPISYVLSNVSEFLTNYTFEITPQVNSSVAGDVCIGDARQLVVNVAPPVGGTVVAASSGTNESFICTGTRETISMQLSGLAQFEVVFRKGSTIETLRKQAATISIRETPTATTEYELVSVTDAYGCLANINERVTVNVDDTDASFSIAGPNEGCSPFKTSLQYNQQVGVTYNWKWTAGADSTYTATLDELNKIVKHTFENPGTTEAKYTVSLETRLADTRYPGCAHSSSQLVKVSPTISIGVFPDVDEVCSGDRVRFTNNSHGVAAHRWYYRVLGSTEELDVRTTASLNYKFVNNTTQNPIIYEVVYEADNGNCPVSTTIPIKVYRGVTAGFDEGVIPPFTAGSAAVTFTNTSSPVDATEFTYYWTFGANANPDNHSGAETTIPVTYSVPGFKDVELIVVNTVAAANNMTCGDTVRKTIEILLPELVAAFKAAPLAACFPTNIEITENTSTGDVYEWQVIDQSGNIAATALSPKPIFRIVNPGTYDIFLETSSSITGQVAFAQKMGIEVFDNPLASLEARPTTLFVPDTELITFNFSTGANFYNWDFDDGTLSEDFEPKHLYSLEGRYQVTLVAGYNHGGRDIDGDGIMDGNVICYDTATREIIARQGGLTKIPNAFTPNKNGPNGGVSGSGTFNDVFLPITKGVAREDGAFVMQIFDRWGTLIFESRNQTKGWDGYDRNGNLVPAGVYVFKLDLRLADGQRTTQVGDVTVIR